MDQQTQKNGFRLPEKKKMEALGRLSCKAAHDFNNILGAIEGYATLAMSSLKADDPLRQDLQEIRGSVAKAAALGRQLTAFGGRQMSHKAPCSIDDIIGKALRRPELAPGGGFRVETRLEPDLPGLTADAALLEQALANLLLNAREAMPGGGTAFISSTAERLESEAVNSADPAAAGNLFLRVSVRDGGPGISEDFFEQLFEPFFSSRKKGVGAGLGLAFVYGTAKQHNGWVEVKSLPGQGAEFSLLIPAARR